MSTNGKKYLSLIPISVIIPTRNSATTVLHTLKSIIEQKYPIEKIIVVDNVSTDDSIKKVKGFIATSKIPMHVIKNKENKGVGASYNIGVKNVTSPFVVFMHSDSSLPTNKELQKLTEPLYRDPKVVATYPVTILPQKVWNTYTFWQKRHQVTGIGRGSTGMNGKFDCIRRDIFLRVGGFDNVYSEKHGVGGEDANLYFSLQKEGKIVLSTAKVIHLHYLGGNYSFFDWIKNRKLLARTYGTLLRLKALSLPLSPDGKGQPFGAILFLIKPTLALMPFLPYFHLLGIVMLFTYAFLNSQKMYTTHATMSDPRIFMLPFVDIFLVYYETFWMLKAFLFVKRTV